MFHQGDLQSGISLAIQEQKLVACFVRQDDDHWSKTWEEQWLTDQGQDEGGETSDDANRIPDMGAQLASKAVLLRIDYGSKEASFLSAFCPIDKAPTLVIINNGILVEKLEGGISQEEFNARLGKAIGLDTTQSNIATNEDSTETSEAASTSAAQDVPVPESQSTEPAQSSANVQSLLNERAQKLEADRLQKETAERAERIARANARRREAQEAEAAHKPDKGKQREGEPPASEKAQARRDWVRQQKQRNDEAKRERERILLQIESDRLARKEKEAQRRELARQEAGAGDDAASTAAEPPASRSGAGPAQSCALQIRLFDGSSIRSRFAPDTTLSTGVRTWITSSSPPQITNVPYTFRLILAPQPSRTIEISEESQSLQELGLMPTATLVLVPVGGYTEAYASSGYTGMLSRGLSAGYGLVSGAFGLAGSVITSVTGIGRGEGPYMGGMSDEQEPSNAQGQQMAGSDFNSGSSAGPSVKVRTLADQRAQEERNRRTELYNGNSLDFEPRKDDKDDKDAKP